MRYYSYKIHDPDSDLADSTGSYVETVSEEEIRLEYYPYWYKRMCERYEQAYIDENYSFEDCLEDWRIIHSAWEVNE